MLGAIITIVTYLIAAAIVIFAVSRLNIGLSVKSFGSAIAAAAVIAIVTGVVAWLLNVIGIRLPSGTGGLIPAILSVIFSAVILKISDKFLSGMTVAGWSGAIIAAIAIAVVGAIVTWLLSLLGITYVM